jgi:hypothetical protein
LLFLGSLSFGSDSAIRFHSWKIARDRFS